MGFDLSKIQAIKNEQNTELSARISEFRSKVDSEKFEDIIQKRAEKTIAGGRSFFSVKVNYYRDNDADKYFVCVDYGFFNVEAYSLAGKQKDEQLALMDKFVDVVPNSKIRITTHSTGGNGFSMLVFFFIFL